GLGAVRRRRRAEDARPVQVGPLLHGAAAGRQREDVAGRRSGPTRGLGTNGRDAERARVHRPASRDARARGTRRCDPLERPVVKKRSAAVVLAVATLSGCASGGGHGTATIWVTRDRGAHVLLIRHVPAGLTAMQ